MYKVLNKNVSVRRILYVSFDFSGDNQCTIMNVGAKIIS